MEDTQDTRSLPTVIIHTVFLAATTLLSLTGNALVCLAFYRKRRLRTITNFYVLSLVVADIMMATFVFPFRTVASGMRRWPFNDKFCQLSGFVQFQWTTVSISTLALTSINRYFCVVKPQRYSVYFTKKNTVLSILSVWIFQLVVCVTFNSSTHASYRWHPKGLFCKDHYQSEGTESIAYIIFTCFIFLSMLAMLLGYGRVYSVVRQHNRAIVPSNSLQHSANSQVAIRAQEIKTSRVLFAAVFGFCISWIPTNVVIILRSFFEKSIPTTVEAMPAMFSSISSWINPIIYGVMNRAMRKEFQNILLCRKGE